MLSTGETEAHFGQLCITEIKNPEHTGHCGCFIYLHILEDSLQSSYYIRQHNDRTVFLSSYFYKDIDLEPKNRDLIE